MNFDRMRELFLDQAIRGELVSQLAEEGVVEQIGAAPEEVPFKIPESWSWIRVEELAVKRKTIDPSTLTNDEIELWSIPAYDAGVAEKVSPGDIGSSKKVVQVGDVLLAKIVPHIKRVWVVSESANSLMKLASTEWLVYASELFLPEFMGLLFRAPYFRTKMMESVSGMGSLKRANPRILAKVWLPVPPIKEQERIVTRLGEAFAEIDRAEKAYEELQTLAGVLRGQILQEAIKGKLVPQLAEEGVVEHIGAAPDEVPFEIPESWQWVQLNRICTLKSGVDMSPSVLLNEPVVDSIPYITGGSQIGQSGELLITRWTSKATNISEKGDVLLICKGSGLGRTALNSYGSVHIARQIMAIRKTKEAIPQYLDLLLKWRWESLRSAAKGVIPGISRKDVLSLLVPLPPVTEQVRIVAKVDDLLKQVNALSA